MEAMTILCYSLTQVRVLSTCVPLQRSHLHRSSLQIPYYTLMSNSVFSVIVKSYLNGQNVVPIWKMVVMSFLWNIYKRDWLCTGKLLFWTKSWTVKLRLRCNLAVKMDLLSSLGVIVFLDLSHCGCVILN